MNNYYIQISNQTLTRKSKRDDFTHALIGRKWDFCNERFDSNFKIITLRTSKAKALKELESYDPSLLADSQVVQLKSNNQ